MKTRLLIIIVIIIAGSSISALFFLNFSGNQNVKNVPENDKYCYSEIIVKTSEYKGGIVERKLVELMVRDEISKFGAIYDDPQRNILVTDLGENNLRITLDGSWSLKQNRPNLLDSLTEHNEIEKILENKGNLIVVGCQ